MTKDEVQLEVLLADKQLPSFLQAIVCFSGVFLMISFGLFVYEVSIHTIIFLALVWGSIQAALLGYSFRYSKQTNYNLSVGVGTTDNAQDVSLNFRVPMTF